MKTKRPFLIAAAVTIALLFTLLIVILQKRNFIGAPQTQFGGSVAHVTDTALKAHTDKTLNLPATTVAKETSKLGIGVWMNTEDMQDRGISSPENTLETFLWAQEGGDINRLVGALFLNADAQAKADQWFTSLPLEKRAEFQSSDRLVAAFLIGGGAAVARSSNSPLTWRHQIEASEPGAGPFALMYGLDQSSATDSHYYTIRTKSRSSANGKGTDPIYVFYHATDGWRYVLPPSMIDALRKMSGTKSPSTNK